MWCLLQYRDTVYEGWEGLLCDVCYNIEVLYVRGGKGLLGVMFVTI